LEFQDNISVSGCQEKILYFVEYFFVISKNLIKSTIIEAD